MLKKNSFSGGSNGTTISTANSGGASGDAWDAVTGSITYSSTNATGNRAPLVARYPGGGTYVNLQWNVTSPAANTLYGRAYVYLTALPSNIVYLFRNLDEGGPALYIQPSGQLAVQGGGFSGGIRASTTQIVALNQWVRVEVKYVYGTTGSCEIRLYNDADSTTLTDTASATSVLIGPAPGAMLFRISDQVYVDDVGISDTDWLGPETSAPTTTPKSATDGGSLTSQTSVAATLARSDAASLTQQASIGLPRTDGGTLSSVAQVQVAHSRTDSGTVTSQALVQVSHLRTDGGHLTEQASIQVTHARADGGTFSEGPRVISLTSADTATLGEASDVDQAFGPSTSDLARLTDQASIAAALPRADAATLAEHAAVHVLRYGTDFATLAETSLIRIPATDTATLAELATVTAVLTATDGVALGELAQAIQPVAAADTMTLTEIATVITLGGDITAVTPPYTDWAASYPFM